MLTDNNKNFTNCLSHSPEVSDKKFRSTYEIYDDVEEEDDDKTLTSSTPTGNLEPSSCDISTSMKISFSSSSSPSISLTSNSPSSIYSKNNHHQKLGGNKFTTQLLSPSSFSIPSHNRFSSFIHKHEVPRKVFHSSIGFITLWLYTEGIQLTQVTPILMTILLVVFSSDFIRFRWPAFNSLYISLLGPLMRQKEINSYNGVIFYLLGLIFVFKFFPKDISLISLLLLSWADTAASTFGRAFGHLTPKLGNQKSLAGSIAAFAIGLFSAVLLYTYFIPIYEYNNLPGDIMWTPETSYIPLGVLVFICGIVGAISEAIDIYDIDDNFTIPVLSALTLYSILYFTKR